MIVVTGGSGFLGGHLICQLLQNGQTVRALKRESTDLLRFRRIFSLYFPQQRPADFSLQWVEGDVLDPSVCLDIVEPGDEVYHCAASVHFQPGQEEQQTNVNVRGTEHIANACLEKRAAMLLFVSSVGAFADAPDGVLICESSPDHPSPHSSVYARSKRKAEREVRRAMAEGLPAVIVNPSVITGPGTGDSGLAGLIRMVGKGLKYYPSGANGWVDVRDVARVMQVLMKPAFAGERFIVSAENLSYQRLLGYIASQLDLPAPNRPVGAASMRLVKSLGDLRQLVTGKPNPLTADLIRISSSVSAYDVSKLRAATAFSFMPVEGSVRDMCAWVRTEDQAGSPL